MTKWLRAGRLMLGIGWETGLGVFLAFVGMSVVGAVGPMLFAFGLKPLVDGIYQRSTGQASLGAAVCAGAMLMLIATPTLDRWVTPRIRERSIMVMQRRLLTLAAGAPGLDHFERADFSDRLQVLKRNFGDLLMGMANVLVGPLIMLQLMLAALVLARLEPLLLVLPVMGVPAAWLNQRAERLRLAADERAAAPRRSLEHLFMLTSGAQSAKEIRVYGLRDELLERHRAVSRGVQQITEFAAARCFAVSLLAYVIFAIGYMAAAVLALRAAASGQLTPGDVVLTLTLAGALITASWRISQMVNLLLRAVRVGEHYHWLSERIAPRRAATTPMADVPDRLRQGYELRGVGFSYSLSNSAALTDITLSLRAGTVVAVVGENGAGKTTLVKLLTRMYEPTAGQILIDGTDLRDLPLAEYRRRLAAGFQDFVHFELVAREAVGVGDLPRIADTSAVLAALERSGAQFAEQLPSGLETQLGRSWENGTDLSGGEWQKLALARAIMREDPLLTVFDEPTSALDPQTEHALFERIARETREHAASGGVTLLISHRFSTVRMADLIVVLQKGRVIEQGSHEELMARPGLYAELYEMQARAYRTTAVS